MDKRTRISDKQLKAIYTIGRVVSGMDADAVDAFCIKIFNAVPADLTKIQAGMIMDFIKFAPEADAA